MITPVRERGKAASAVFSPGVRVGIESNLLTVADLDHSAILSLVYLWSDAAAETTTVRLISARKATQNEILQYREGG